jgi:2,4-dienoyl-CoA reductase-like NADH-dependent reductase (Old Yellow Enzyme family)
MAGLFEPLTIRNLTLKNRVVLPPMGTRLSPRDGSVSDAQVAHYAARARGGVGLIIVEHAYISPMGRFRATQLGAHDDSLLPGLRRLVEAAHAGGAAICLQINHSGGKAFPEVIGEQPAGPSEVTPPGSDHEPRALTKEEIAEIVQAFVAAARRAVAAGFDAVEVHGAHGYLLSQFASPITNHRRDEYGGDLWGRFRLPLDVVAAVREGVPANYPVFYRLGADDLMEGGLSPEEAQQVAPRLLRAGADVLDVSGGVGGDGSLVYDQQGYFVPLAEKIKQASGARVIGVGRIRDPHFADRVVRDGRVDLVAVGRAHLEDPEWAAKAARALGQA